MPLHSRRWEKHDKYWGMKIEEHRPIPGSASAITQRLAAACLLLVGLTMVGCGKKAAESKATAGPSPTKATPDTRPSPKPAGDKTAELIKRGKIKFAMGEYQASLDLLKKAKKLQPGNPETDLYIKKARDELLKQAAAAIPEVPENPEPTEEDLAKNTRALIAEAEQLLKEEKFALPPGDNALEKYRLVLAREPLNRTARTRLAYAVKSCKDLAKGYMDTGKYGKALSYLAQARAMAPSDHWIKEAIAECQGRLSGQIPGTSDASPLAPAPPAPPAPTPTSQAAGNVPTESTPSPSTAPSPSPSQVEANVLPARTEHPVERPTNGGLSPAGRPILLAKSPAVYPRSAWDRKVEGDVSLRLLVMPSGVVGDVELVKASGDVDLDRAAVDAARKYKFRPFSGDGKPRWVSAEIGFHR